MYFKRRKIKRNIPSSLSDVVRNIKEDISEKEIYEKTKVLLNYTEKFSK